MGKDYTVDFNKIDMSIEGVKERRIEAEVEAKNAWINTNSEDRFVTNAERKLVGFYGIKSYSQNNSYCGVYLPGNGTDQCGFVALVDTSLKTLCFKKELMRPRACFVSNYGMVAVVDWLVPGVRGARFYLYDKNGSLILNSHFAVNLKDECFITPNDDYAIFESPDHLFVLDINIKKVIHKYSLDNVKEVIFDFEKMNIIMKEVYGGKKIKSIN